MRRNLDKVEIVEPPLQELTKKRSGFKSACLSGCGCVFILIIVAIVGIRFYIGPGPSILKTVPTNFPPDIPVYDKDNIESITYISGKYKNRGIEIAAFFPKIILSPLLLKNGENSTSTTNSNQDTIKNLWGVITAPVGDHRDTVQIEWRNIDAEPSFVNSYYKTELQKKGYIIEVESKGQAVRQFSFSKPKTDISGSFYVAGDETLRPGTDYAILTVNLSRMPLPPKP